MSINLCNAVFGVNVTSSSVSREGWEPEKLLETNFDSRSGFMAERFMKPPVEVTFSFPFKIEIKEIFIDPMAGSQISNGFEIYTACCMDQKKDEPGLFFQTIGRSLWHGPDLSIYHFVNQRYRPRFKELDNISTDSWVAKTNSESSLPLRHQFSKFLRDVSHLKVKITKTRSGSIPSIRRINIQGQPSFTCQESEIDDFLTKTTTLSRSNEPRNNVQEISECHTSSSATKIESNKDLDLIKETLPEEFVDPLTCILMTMPVILPSGHTIDQSSLDKHVTAEATWGRPPSDPFTGVCFTEVSRPLPNLLLKARVDHFILMSGKKYEHLPRSTAKASLEGKSLEGIKKNTNMNGAMTAGPSILVEQQEWKKDRIKFGTSSHSVPASISEQSMSSSTKSPSEGRESCFLKRRRDSYDKISMGPEVKKTSVLQGAYSHNHEEALEDSLTDALNVTLARFPSFTMPLDEDTSVSTKQDTVCSHQHHQNVDDGSTEHLYQFPCKHIYCRPCLVKSLSHNLSSGGPSRGDQYRCASCQSSFQSGDIVRIHKK